MKDDLLYPKLDSNLGGTYMLRYDRVSGFMSALMGLLIVSALSLLNAQPPTNPGNLSLIHI